MFKSKKINRFICVLDAYQDSEDNRENVMIITAKGPVKFKQI